METGERDGGGDGDGRDGGNAGAGDGEDERTATLNRWRRLVVVALAQRGGRYAHLAVPAQFAEELRAAFAHQFICRLAGSYTAEYRQLMVWQRPGTTVAEAAVAGD